MIFQQSSFRAGTLTASLPTVVVAKPLMGAVLGMVVLGETLDTTGPGLVVVAFGVVLVLVATIALARGEAEKVAEEAVESGHIPATMPHRAVTMHFGPADDDVQTDRLRRAPAG